MSTQIFRLYLWLKKWLALGVVTGSEVVGGGMTALDKLNVQGDSTADDDWLGLASDGGRIEFDDQATDEVNILSANVGIGTSTPGSLLTVGSSGQFRCNCYGESLPGIFHGADWELTKHLILHISSHIG